MVRLVTDVLLCVGNSMMGDDAGPITGGNIARRSRGNWVVIDGGSAPEKRHWRFANCAHSIC